MLPQRRANRFRQWMIGIAVLLIFALPLVYSAIVVPLAPSQQAIAGLTMIGLAAAASYSRVLRPAIIFLSCFASVRYLYWRVSSTLNGDTAVNAAVSAILLAAEIYGIAILFLGYFQTIETEERTVPPLRRTPRVDVYIPTYNEPADIVRRTLIGALALDYPEKEVYVLDDGRRPAIEEMVRRVGGHYLTRPDNRGAKAGNLNHAMKLTSGELIAIFDADHVPVRSFLRSTTGFFEDPRVALVQTAQHFYNPDPFERNLRLTGRIAPEQHFFYHVVQCGNDFWNSAFFCGSCAVLRRSAVESIGGILTRTVTEDAHTAMELHARGFDSVYLPMPMAAGLATETFAAHVQQRMRWARGMAQILRLDCPLFKKGLSLPQRLNYFNAMLHFFFGIPRLVLMLAPLLYLYFGLHPIRADSLAVIAYILPHIGLCTIANSIISKRFRHSFWAGVYEVSIAPYTAGVTLMAMLNPRLGKFNVTDKGASLDESYFDLRTSRGTVALLVLTLAAMTIAFPLRIYWYTRGAGDPAELDAILLNSVWAVANLFTLVAATCVGLEQPQQRGAPRVKRSWPCAVSFGDRVMRCRTSDLSESGVRIELGRGEQPPRECRIRISGDFGVEAEAVARLVWCDLSGDTTMEAAYQFEQPDESLTRQLVELMFCGENSWAEQQYATDRMLRSLWYLVATFWRATGPRQAKTVAVVGEPRGVNPHLRKWMAAFK